MTLSLLVQSHSPNYNRSISRSLPSLAGPFFLLLIATALVGLSAEPTGIPVSELKRAGFIEHTGITHPANTALDEAEVSKLIEFIKRVPTGDAVNDHTLAIAKKHAVDALIGQTVLKPELSDVLSQQIADFKQASTWREYALERIGDLALRSGNAREGQSVVNMLLFHLQSPEGNFSGKALVGLGRISSAKPDLLSSDQVAGFAAGILERPGVAPTTQADALRVLVKADTSKGTQAARSYLGSDSSPVVQESALGVLAEAGAPTDVPLVQPFLASKDNKLKSAAEAAYRKLSGKNP